LFSRAGHPYWRGDLPSNAGRAGPRISSGFFGRRCVDFGGARGRQRSNSIAPSHRSRDRPVISTVLG
jgi:hypothetical protein